MPADKNQNFKKTKGESFGDFVVKKITDSEFYFQPDQVWKEIEDTKEEVLGQTLDMAPTIQSQNEFEKNINNEIKLLEAEIQKLKVEEHQTSEIQQEIQEKEAKLRLQEAKVSLEKIKKVKKEEVVKKSYYDDKEKEYRDKGIVYENKRFPWKVNRTDSLSSEKLPLRLYNVETKKIEEIKEGADIKNYAILSYV